MAFKVIKIELTEEQIEKLTLALCGGKEYALLAEPEIDSATLNVQILTLEQFDILCPAILQAHKLPRWRC